MLSFLGINLCPHDNVGLCNQMYNLLNGIIDTINESEQQKIGVILFIGKFLCEIKSNKICNVSDILNLRITNDLIRRKHNIQLVDINNFNLVVNNIILNKTNDITSLVTIKKNRISMKDINELVKINDTLTFVFTVDNIQYSYDALIEDTIKEDIKILDIFKCDLRKFPIVGSTKFATLAPLLIFNDQFIDYPKNYMTILKQYTKINCIHLRLDPYFLEHFMHKGKSMSDNIAMIEQKYLTRINELINKDDLTIIVGEHYDNKVIQYMKDNNYKFLITNKIYDQRELNALNDLHIGMVCNNVFIGNHESSFSGMLYYRNNAVSAYLIQLYDPNE